MIQRTTDEAPYLGALREIHRLLRPRNYLEIGCRFGDSLFLAECPTIGVDPVDRLAGRLRPDDQFFEMTSDDFFARYTLAGVGRGPVDLAFIDGMHLSEFALRDFINIEAQLPRTGVIVLDDVLPARIDMAGRTPETFAWAGDVYKVIAVLKHYRPDLRVDVFAVPITGLAIVRGLDPASRVLSDAYVEIEADLLADRWSLSTVERLRADFDARPASEVATSLME